MGNSPNRDLPDLSIDEVKKHNKRKDCWVIFNNKVLDVSKYLNKHPGGDCIIKFAGSDITNIFNKYNHSKVAYDLALSFSIHKNT